MSQLSWLSQRELEPEIMDDPGLDPTRHVAALQGLARLNHLSSSVRIVWSPIAKLARRLKVDRLRILDVATGAGDIPVGLWHRARRTGLQLEIQGVDVSPLAIEFARQRAEAQGAKITFERRDVLTEELPRDFDVVISSLFFHHLKDDQAIALLRSMASVAKQMILVNDLRRNLGGWMLAHAAARVLTTSDVVHTDAPLSAKAAYTMDEIANLARAANLEGVTVQRRWPCRLLMTWIRPPDQH